MSQLVFSLKDVCFSYPGDILALKDLTLEINKGECVAIIGPNGSGKSTLLSLLDALEFPQKGTIKFLELEITEKRMRDADIQKDFRKRVGFVFQNPEIQLFCPTVREDIVFGPLHLGIQKSIIEQRLKEIADKLKISHLLDRAPHQLSIGEKKKVAIATVLIIEPEVFLLDEPTAGLDPSTTRDIINVIKTAHNNGKTIVISTHDLHIVEEISEIVHVIGNNKSIIKSGKAEEILTDSDFLQKNNLMHIHIHRHFDIKHIHPHIHSKTI
jgi:cobalt/nickel transport system ATP-binding protein